MIAKSITIDLALVLLIVAVALFVWAAFTKAPRVCIPIGLACFAGAFLAERLL